MHKDESTSMRFFFYNHQNKGLPLVRAMQAAGWTWTAQSATAAAVFSDSDVPSRIKSLKGFLERGAKIFLYPHAARPNLFNDFEGYPWYPNVTANFVLAEGHIEILKRIGVQHTFEAVGWYMCPMKPFQPREQARKILFAPIHPNANGTLSSADRKVNADTFRKLLALVGSGQIDLTVRYLRDLDKQGMWMVDGVNYIKGEADGSYVEIDQADLVVSHQTFAHIAIARGVPTVMMGEDFPPRIGCEEYGTFKYVKNFDKYKDLLMYPLDILAEDDTLALFERAIRSDEEIADWRRRLIGEPFGALNFIKKVMRYM